MNTREAEAGSGGEMGRGVPGTWAQRGARSCRHPGTSPLRPPRAASGTLQADEGTTQRNEAVKNEESEKARVHVRCAHTRG